jgi:hypothetical protein
LEDEQLMLEYAAGDLRSFERLFERWAPRLHAFFRRSSGSAVDADDLLQATFPEPFGPGDSCGASGVDGGVYGGRGVEKCSPQQVCNDETGQYEWKEVYE